MTAAKIINRLLREGVIAEVFIAQPDMVTARLGVANDSGQAGPSWVLPAVCHGGSSS